MDGLNKRLDDLAKLVGGFGDRLTRLEGRINELSSAPQSSVSDEQLAAVKSGYDATNGEVESLKGSINSLRQEFDNVSSGLRAIQVHGIKKPGDRIHIHCLRSAQPDGSEVGDYAIDFRPQGAGEPSA